MTEHQRPNVNVTSKRQCLISMSAHMAWLVGLVLKCCFMNILAQMDIIITSLTFRFLEKKINFLFSLHAIHSPADRGQVSHQNCSLPPFPVVPIRRVCPVPACGGQNPYLSHVCSFACVDCSSSHSCSPTLRGGCAPVMTDAVFPHPPPRKDPPLPQCRQKLKNSDR